jgi:hypothetical protein
MPKRTSTPRLDAVQNAHRVMEESVQQATLEVLNPAAVSRIMAEMGRKGGSIGGKRRLETMTPERRREVASQAAKARWAKTKKPKKKRG